MILTASILAVLITSFFCSLSEASLLSLGRARVEVLAQRGGVGRVIQGMKHNLDRPIATILILNTVANTGGAAVAGAEYRRLFGDSTLVAFSAGLTVAVLVFSEIIPKSIGVRNAEGAAAIIARPLQVLIGLLRPMTWLVEQMTRASGARPHRTHVSIDDIRAMARLAASAQVLGREELMIIDAAARLPRVPIRQIMIHAPDIVYFSLTEGVETNLVRARRSLHSRLLLCRDQLDDVIGLVSMKEVLWRLADDGDAMEEDGLHRILAEAMREPVFADPDIDVSDLIKLFATTHSHLAVVRDKTDKVVGIVTLEDVVEELMGELDDEFDRMPDLIEQRTESWWRIGGGAAWRDVQSRLSLPATEPLEADLDDRVDMNDIVADHLPGRLRTGATFRLGAWDFRVVRMRRGKVVLVDALRPTTRPMGVPAADPVSTPDAS